MEHCDLFSPEQGFTKALQITITLYGNPGVITDISVSRQTKDLLYRKKTNTSYIHFLSTKSNNNRTKERSAFEGTQNEIQIQPLHILWEINFMRTLTGLQILT